MSQQTEPRLHTALDISLPKRAYTRGGASFDPSGDLWEWTDGPFSARLDFGRYKDGFEAFVSSLKQVLLAFIRHSSSHVSNLQQAFFHFVKSLERCPGAAIGARHVSDYAAKLGAHEVGRLSTLSVLLQKWVDLGLPGVEPECAKYLSERRKPCNNKGEAVRTRNPINGPFCEEEYTALNSSVNAAYGRGQLPMWTLLLTRLLFACGGRISQYASLKVRDFNGMTSVLSLPQAKTGEEHARSSLLDFDISPQTARLISDYIKVLQLEGYDDDAAFFPEKLVMLRGPNKPLREIGDLFFGHCTAKVLSSRFNYLMKEIAPPTSRLGFSPTPVTSQRFRYTFGTRLAEEGASIMVIANRLGHADLQNVRVYVAASPKIVESIDKAMGALLAPLAMAFKGQLVEDEDHTTNQGIPGSRIVDFRTSKSPIGSCADKAGGCAFNKPVACYTCFRFEPWLDAPHDKVLVRFYTERDKCLADDRMASVNDEAIRAVQEVIALCAQVRQQREEQESEGDT